MAGAQFLKRLLERREASAAEREGQMSRRKVGGKAMLGPGGCEKAMTGSMRMRVERRRGCMAERWTLGVGVSWRARVCGYGEGRTVGRGRCCGLCR